MKPSLQAARLQGCTVVTCSQNNITHRQFDLSLNKWRFIIAAQGPLRTNWVLTWWLKQTVDIALSTWGVQQKSRPFQRGLSQSSHIIDRLISACFILSHLLLKVRQGLIAYAYADGYPADVLILDEEALEYYFQAWCSRVEAYHRTVCLANQWNHPSSLRSPFLFYARK